MTTYYVSVTNGSDAANGLGPDASHASNKPWLTIGKALNTGSPVVPGDTIYIGPGIYYGEVVTPIAGVCSVGSPTALRGDPLNVQGFKNSSGVRVAPGLVYWTSRTSGEGKDGASAANTHGVRTDTNNPSGLQFYNLVIDVGVHAGSMTVFLTGVTTSDVLFEDCLLIGVNILQILTGVPAANRNYTFRRCEMFCARMLLASIGSAASTADADLNILVEHCLIYGALGATIALSASGGNLAGGIRFKGNTIFLPGGAGTNGLSTVAARISTVMPIRLEGNLFLCVNTAAINAGTAGQVVDDGYNRILSGANVNFTPAGTTISNVQANLVFASLKKWGLHMPRIDFFGWTDDAHANQKDSAWSNTSPGFRGRTPRPWGAGASIGAWETISAVQDTASAITGGGTNSMKLTGGGEISLYVPVDAVATTISVRTKSTSYGGANFPQLIVVANPSLGIAADVVVTAAAATEETITTASFTPTAKGVVEVRLISRSSSVSSATFFDLLTSP